MPPDPLLDQEDDYVSSEDSDFAPEAAPERDSTPSEDEADSTPNQPASTGKRKRQAGDQDAEDAGFENSGDEAIIGKGKKRLKRVIDDDGGGEGGLIKTRSQRAKEKVEKQHTVAQGPVTIDVDALWQQMLNDDAPGVPVPAPKDAPDGADKPASDEAPRSGGTSAAAAAAVETANGPEATIRIRRTYNFAGKVHTEEKVVARDSAEARLYLASLGTGDVDAGADGSSSPPKRMPRKAFRSAFEPVSDAALQRRADLNLGLGVRMRARELATRAEAKKLNTVEKSRMDWAGYVDKEGIKDELELAGKSKTSFVARQDFLARSEARREEDARRARLAGKV